MTAAEQIHYCRVPLPKGGEWGGNLYVTRLAINEVLDTLDLAEVDPAAGSLRVTYDMDSTVTRESVLAEWRPNK